MKRHRHLCAEPLAARVARIIGKTQVLEKKLVALEKDQLLDVILACVKNGELSRDALQTRLPEPRFSFDATDRLPAISSAALRFEIGQTVECRMGTEEWARGKVVGLYYREDDWPEGQKAPYQVLLEGDGLVGRTIWAPSDSDECIRATVRFDVGAAVQCCVGEDRWVSGTVVAHYYREPDWPIQLLAPYRVLLDGRVEGHPDKEVYLWAPLDADDCIKALEEGAIVGEQIAAELLSD